MSDAWKTFEAELALTDTVSHDTVLAALAAVPEAAKRAFIEGVARRLGGAPLPFGETAKARARALEDVMTLTALKRGREGEGLLAFEMEETVGTQKRLKLLTSFAWVEAFKAAAKDTGVIEGPERETPEQHARTVARRYVDPRAVASAMAGGGATASLRTLLDLALGRVEPTPSQLGMKPSRARVFALRAKYLQTVDAQLINDIRTGTLTLEWYAESPQARKVTQWRLATLIAPMVAEGLEKMALMPPLHEIVEVLLDEGACFTRK